MNARCYRCGEIYVLQSSAWGDECGACIAAKIELMLMGGIAARDRMPMRRASDLREDTEHEGVTAPATPRAVGE